MAGFVEAARLDALPPGKGTVVTVAARDVALFNVDGTIYAMDDACLHQGQSLSNGRLDGKILTCLGHGWRYNVTTGRLLQVPDLGVEAYPTKVVDGTILIAVP